MISVFANNFLPHRAALGGLLNEKSIVWHSAINLIAWSWSELNFNAGAQVDENLSSISFDKGRIFFFR